ncbi:MAG: RsbRD N-terminal domain-containing protein [Desulfovibrionaceae bacterium]|nr:RsbRD N-terminal domain-containing protein [Desulfovibrionaceae bacterium]MDD4952200.1 RsbRD N-terminal domain-containing protein [Desulfovibrionaceae bacterium]
MSLEDKLAARKTELVGKWGDVILATYPAETQKVWKRQRDRFANPVGVTILETAQNLFDLLLCWQDAEAIANCMEMLIKIRAVQQFSPSQAISFVFLLKKLLREELGDELRMEGAIEELMSFETRIDNLALMAFDIYSKSREQVYEMRIKEIKLSHRMLMRKADMIADVAAPTADK